MNRQPHPDNAKTRARQVYEHHGAAQASETTGVSVRTIRRWAATEQWPRQTATPQPRGLHVAPVPETRQPTGKSRVTPIGYGYQYQRRALLRRLAGLATLALDQVETELAAGRTVKARDGMVVCGIALDKAEQLAKAAGPDLAGDRPDTAEAVARLQEMLADLSDRRTGTDGHPS